MKKLLASFALAIAALGMVGGTASAATNHMTARQVANKLVRLGCHATPPDPSTVNIDVGIKAKAELDCTIAGEDVTINEYRNAQQLAYSDMMAKGIGCVYLKAFGMTGAVFVEAENWSVTPSTAITAHAIQRALGHESKVITIHCS